MRRFSGRKMALIAAPLAVAIVAVPMATSAQALDLPLIGPILGVLDLDDLGENVPFTNNGTLVKLCVADGVIVDTSILGAPGCDDEVAAVQGAKGDPGTNGTNGTNGAPGTAGTNGTNGKNGVSGYSMKTKEFSVAAGKITSLKLSCASGKKVTGGGVYAASSSIVPLSNHPASDAKSWKAKVANTSRSKHTVKLYAICAKV